MKQRYILSNDPPQKAPHLEQGWHKICVVPEVPWFYWKIGENVYRFERVK